MLSIWQRPPKPAALALALCLCALAGPATAPARAQFIDHFTGPALDPAWLVVPYTGPFPRAHGLVSPANDHSTTANPGHLRYLLYPMTHADGFFLGYPTTTGLHSCCTHDPGLELHRPFSGDRWVLEAKGTFFFPYTNGRGTELRVYFGDGTVPTYYATIVRGRDVNQNYLNLLLWERTGPALTDRTILAAAAPGGSSFSPIFGGPDTTTVYWRLQRSGGLLTSQWSLDGISWTTAFSHDLGNQLDGLGQRVVVTGQSWFVSAGSYADWDYIALVPSVLTVAIDVQPGEEPNSVHPTARGVLPVAVLSTSTAAGEAADFDARDLDPVSVTFGPADAAPEHPGGHLEDVDADGDLDRVFHFLIPATGLECGDVEGTLTGTTFDGAPVQGKDALRTVGCR